MLGFLAFAMIFLAIGMLWAWISTLGSGTVNQQLKYLGFCFVSIGGAVMFLIIEMSRGSSLAELPPFLLVVPALILLVGVSMHLTVVIRLMSANDRK